MRPLAIFALLASICSLTATAQPAATQPARLSPEVERVMKYVPDSAHAVLVVPSLDSLVAGVSAFGKAVGATELAEFDAPRALQELGGSAAALNTHGALIVALSADREEPLLIASLTSDESWKSSTQPTTIRDGVLLYEFSARRFVAASTGDVAIFAREKEELRRALDATGRFAERFTKEAGDLLGRRQAVLYVEVPPWTAAIEGQMAVAVQSMYMGMAAAGPEAELAMQLWEWMLGAAKKLLGETRTYVASARVDAQGLFMDGRATFKPDSGMARYLKQVHRPRRDLLRGLPAGEAPAVLAFEWEDAPDTVGFNEALCKAVLNMEPVKEKIGAEKIEALMKKSVDVNRKVPGSSAVFSILPEGRGILYWGLYLTRDGPLVQRELRSIFELAPDMMSAWGNFPAAMRLAEPVKVGGVEADAYQLSFTAEGSPVQPVLQVVYGKDPTLYMAPHSEGVVYAFGPQEYARQKLAELLTAGSALLSQDPRALELSRTLSPHPQAWVLLDLPSVATGVMALAAQMGLPVPTLEIGDAKMPLAGFTLYLDPDALRGEVFVPAQPVKLIIKAAEGFKDAADKAY